MVKMRHLLALDKVNILPNILEGLRVSSFILMNSIYNSI